MCVYVIFFKHTYVCTLIFVAAPDPPMNISTQFSQFENSSQFVAVLTWNSSTIDEQSYTNLSYNININPSPNNSLHQPILINTRSLLLVLFKNVPYNVGIASVNCVGRSSITYQQISFNNYLRGKCIIRSSSLILIFFNQ